MMPARGIPKPAREVLSWRAAETAMGSECLTTDRYFWREDAGRFVRMLRFGHDGEVVRVRDVRCGEEARGGDFLGVVASGRKNVVVAGALLGAGQAVAE